MPLPITHISPSAPPVAPHEYPGISEGRPDGCPAEARLAGGCTGASGRADLSARLCSALLCTLTGVRSPVAPHGLDGCTDGGA